MGELGHLDRLDPILPLVGERADWANEHRRPDQEVFTRLAEAGLLRLQAPEPYGGHGITPNDFLALIESVGRVDGSAAWTFMTLNEEVGIASAHLPAESMTRLLTEQPDTIIAGSGVAVGRAVRTDGGWIVNGRWKFVSGAPVADRLILASLVRSNDPTDRSGEDQPRRPRQVCFTLVPVADAVIEDTWHVAGLRGTGSNDAVLADVFVPDEWAGVIGGRDLPVPDTPFYRLPNGLRFPFPKTGVAIGIARAALAEFDELASDKKPSLMPQLLGERPTAQSAVAHAAALVGAGRAWVAEQVDELWAVSTAGGVILPDLHARVRLSCSYAVESAIAAVELLATAAGTTASQLDGPWPRLLGDVRSVGQHFMVAPHHMQTAGRVLLGRDVDDPTF